MQQETSKAAHFVDFFAGTPSNVPRTNAADGVNSFDLTDDEIAFVNAIDFHISDLKDIVFNTIAKLQEDFDKKADILKVIKKDFINAALAKRGLTSKTAKVDTVNSILVLKSDEDVPVQLPS